jgi:hypothetical protein
MLVKGQSLIKGFPIINDRRIHTIYTTGENSRYEGKGKSRMYVQDPILYECLYDGGFREPNGRILLKTLPNELAKFFGLISNKDKTMFANSIHFRQSGSGNGGFVDDLFYVRGWASNATSEIFSWYGEDINSKGNCCIDSGSPLHKALMGFVGNKYTLDEAEFHECNFNMKERTLDFASKYPYAHSSIQYIDGLVYPDVKLDSWRWLHGYPYVRQDRADITSYPENIRVYDQILEQHLYLRQAKEEDIGMEAITVTFAWRDSGDQYGRSWARYFCRIRQYNERKGHNYVKHTVTQEDINKWASSYIITSISKTPKNLPNIKTIKP